MFKISRFTCENLRKGCVTDEGRPHFSYSVESDRQGASLAKALLTVGDWQMEGTEQIAVPYGGSPLQPFTVYQACLQVWDDGGETDSRTIEFETGRMDTPWQAHWISDGDYHFTEKKVSPVPMTFRRCFTSSGRVKSARIYATAMGIYELTVNGEKAGNRYFAPGFTSYQTRLQYQTYDVTKLLGYKSEVKSAKDLGYKFGTNEVPNFLLEQYHGQSRDMRGYKFGTNEVPNFLLEQYRGQARDMQGYKNEINVVVAGGWAVGSFVFTRKNRISADRQALLLELRITYEDGSVEVIGTDESWEVTEEGNYRAADFYDGELYDATVDLRRVSWRKAVRESLRISPRLYAETGAPVTAHERLEPVSCTRTKQGLIYDFGQNFAGVVDLVLKGRKGQQVTVRHGELLNPDGSLNTAFLRTARATAVYICRDGVQRYSPRLTYMGFKYICVEGIEEENIQAAAIALYSDLERNGTFECSSELLNRLQSNIVWSARSNFMDIPTDCPQRDERMGWTGDIAVFAPTACYNFNMSRFLDKWLGDVAAEQLPTGGIPNTVPAQGYGFPATMPVLAVDFWGDACVLVPWAEYRARGDKRILEACYPMMKKYVNACRFWAGLFSVGKHRYLWHTPSVLHFGDWVAPDVPRMSQWQKRSRWTATASLKNTSGLLSQIADILGETRDAEKYRRISERTAEAYRDLLTDGEGRLKEEFQTAYVLPLQFGIFPEEVREKAVSHLVRLVEEKDYCIGTGFPGTPYILFALADNGRADVAYRMLFNEKCPSWLYEVRAGATTIWERWDGLDEKGVCPIGDDGTGQMISYNHYASGAVGDFLYRRVAGIEALEPGYKSFRVRPVLCEQLKSARGALETPYGEIRSEWKREGSLFFIQVKVPVGTLCRLQLPDGSEESLESGSYVRQCAVGREAGDILELRT